PGTAGPGSAAQPYLGVRPEHEHTGCAAERGQARYPRTRRSSVAKTIGKDKGTATSARLSSRSRGGAVNKPAKAEPRDQELLAGDTVDATDTVDSAETDDALVTASSDSTADDTDAELALPETRVIARRGATEIAPRSVGIPKVMRGNRFTR